MKLKLFSFLLKIKNKFVYWRETKFNLFWLKSLAHIKGCKFEYGKCVRIANRIDWQLRKGSKLKLGDNVSIRSECMIIIRENATLEIDSDSYIGYETIIGSMDSIRIGKSTLIASRCAIIDYNHNWSGETGVIRDQHSARPIEIGNKVWLALNVVVTADSVIGDRCLIGPCVVVRGVIKEGQKILKGIQ